MTEQKEGFSIQEKLTKRQKYFQFIGVPILLYIVFYLFYQLLIHFFHMETHDSLTLETLAVTLGVSIVHWIGLVYPSKPASESTKSNKSLKEYIKQYVIKGTLFHRVMLMLYSLCAIILITIGWLTLTGRL